MTAGPSGVSPSISYSSHNIRGRMSFEEYSRHLSDFINKIRELKRTDHGGALEFMMQVDQFGNNILFYAAKDINLYISRIEEIIGELYEIDNSKIKDFIMHRNNRGWNALYECKSSDIALALINYLENPEDKKNFILGYNNDQSMISALDIIVMKNYFHVVKVFVDQLEKICPELLFNILTKPKGTIISIMQHAIFQLNDSKIASLFIDVIKKKDPAFLLNCIITDFYRHSNLLYYYADSGDILMVGKLFDIVAELDPSRLQEFILHKNGSEEISALIKVILNNNIPMVTELTNKVNEHCREYALPHLLQPCIYGRNPLHYAAYKGSIRILELLLNAITNFYPEKDYIFSESQDGDTIFHTMTSGFVDNPMLIKVLIDRLESVSAEEKSAFFMKRNNNGYTALHLAVFTKQYKNAFALINFIMGIDSEKAVEFIFMRDKNGNTILHFICSGNKNAPKIDLQRLLEIIPRERRRDFVDIENNKGQKALRFLLDDQEANQQWIELLQSVLNA